MKWPLLDVQPGGLQSRQALKDARSPSPAHIVVSKKFCSVLLLSHQLFFPYSWQKRQTNAAFPTLPSMLRTVLSPSPSFSVNECFNWKMHICLHLPINHCLWEALSVLCELVLYIYIFTMQVLWFAESRAFVLVGSVQEARASVASSVAVLWMVTPLRENDKSRLCFVPSWTIMEKLVSRWQLFFFFMRNELMLGC